MSANVQNVPDTGYFKRYISLVNDDDIIGYLENQCRTTEAFFRSIGEEKSKFRYAEGKWSIKQIVGHLSDAERIFAYRALRFARNDKTVLNSFEENDFVDNAFFDDRAFDDLVDELILIRKSNLALFRSFSEDVLERKGTAGVALLSVRNILYVIAGHQLHHLKVISERYGV